MMLFVIVFCRIVLQKKSTKPVIYLDQFATSELFQNQRSEIWNEIFTLLELGYNRGSFFCPLSIEHFLETSSRIRSKAEVLHQRFVKLSGNSTFKSELMITSQLIISKIRGNNITQNTYLGKLDLKYGLEATLDKMQETKSVFGFKIQEATQVSNELRKVMRSKKMSQSEYDALLKAHQFLSISEFKSRLIDTMRDGFIKIRPVHFSSGSVSNWIDSIIYRLVVQHKLKKKEGESLIRLLEAKGFDLIPTLDIRTKLTAFNSVNQKKEIASDHIDIGRIAIGLPISEIFLTDRRRKNEIEQLGLDKKYSTKVFTGTYDDLTTLTKELERQVENA